MAECGTTAAYQAHKRKQEEPCQPCKDAWAEYYRLRPTTPKRELQPCGTMAAYKRHCRDPEKYGDPCPKCIAASKEYFSKYEEAHKKNVLMGRVKRIRRKTKGPVQEAVQETFFDAIDAASVSSINAKMEPSPEDKDDIIARTHSPAD